MENKTKKRDEDNYEYDPAPKHLQIGHIKNQEKRLIVICRRLENSQLESVKNVLIEIVLNPRNLVPNEDLVIVVGAMAHGQIKTDYTEDTSINNYPLSGAIACNQLCKMFEEVWGVV
ncbi:NEP1 methyltransferase, partial [Acromyrmex insinuator]